jgi:hypothetical protein
MVEVESVRRAAADVDGMVLAERAIERMSIEDMVAVSRRQ